MTQKSLDEIVLETANSGVTGNLNEETSNEFLVKIHSMGFNDDLKDKFDKDMEMMYKKASAYKKNFEKVKKYEDILKVQRNKYWDMKSDLGKKYAKVSRDFGDETYSLTRFFEKYCENCMSDVTDRQPISKPTKIY